MLVANDQVGNGLFGLVRLINREDLRGRFIHLKPGIGYGYALERFVFGARQRFAPFRRVRSGLRAKSRVYYRAYGEQSTDGTATDELHLLAPAMKMDLGMDMWTPLLPSTSSVMLRSAATLESIYASSRERCFSVTRKSIISRIARVAHAFRSSLSPMVM